MIRVRLNNIDYEIRYQHGVYIAAASEGQAPMRHTLEELSQALSELTGIEAEDILNLLKDLGA